MNLLLLSNSTTPGEAYLHWPLDLIDSALGRVREALFIPYAAVGFSFDLYEQKVQEALSTRGITATSIHHSPDPVAAVTEAQAIIIGGGNSFQLLNGLYRHDLIEAIRDRVFEGVPYIGWSAGSNVACPTIKTTNDMPITEPPSFDALALVPFQINPHFTEKTIEAHGGESRIQRLMEYAALNTYPVFCLPEGSALKHADDNWSLIAPEPVKLLKPGGSVQLVNPGSINQLPGLEP